jgi:hypothetical protein
MFAHLVRPNPLRRWERWICRVSTPWRGDESLAGKTILVYSDGGLGDTIQFCRFVPLLAQRGARVILRVQKKLRALLSMSVTPLADRVSAHGELLPGHDFHCSLLRLPMFLGTTLETIPSSRSYLRADATRVAEWSKRLGPRRRPRVGISWAGSKFNSPYNSHRSIPLEALRPLTKLDCELISLQRPIPKDDGAALRVMPGLSRLGESLMDFAEIAALIENLDLVIAVDSAIAHLAGSLGKPVWLLLCYAPDWRWLTHITHSPWYPTARLFRQPAPGAWDGVLTELQGTWRQLVGEQSSDSGQNGHLRKRKSAAIVS